MPTKEVLSFPHQCGSPATSQMHAAKTQPGLFPSTDTTRIINMETGESPPTQYNVSYRMSFHSGKISGSV